MLLGNLINIHPRAMPLTQVKPVKGQSSFQTGSTSSGFGKERVVLSQPGSSRVKAIKRTASFACAYVRQLLAVALTEQEHRIFRCGQRLSRAPLKPFGPGLSWYLISGKRINIRFARWCVTHYMRGVGLDPRPPDWIIKLPTLDFLQNYSVGGYSFTVAQLGFQPSLSRLNREPTPLGLKPSGPQDNPEDSEVKLHGGGAGQSSPTSSVASSVVSLQRMSESARARLEANYSDKAFGLVAFGY